MARSRLLPFTGIASICVVLITLAVSVGQATDSGGIIAFVSDRGGRYEIYLADASTGQTRKLIHGSRPDLPLDEFDPLWSPDSQHIAFIARFPNQDRRMTSAYNGEVMVATLADGTLRNLTRHPADTEFMVDWSPDSQQLLLLSNRNRDIGDYGRRQMKNLFVATTTANQVQQVGSYEFRFTRPRWSPDGRFLAFEGPGNLYTGQAMSARDWETELYVVDGECGSAAGRCGTNLRQLTQNDQDDGFPAWSPDSSQLAFMSPVVGDVGIYVMDTACIRLPADCAPRQIARGVASRYFNGSTSLIWSPDNRYLAVVLYSAGNADIYRVEVATGDIRNLTSSRGNDLNPSWSPDSQHLVFTSNRSGNLDVYVMAADGSGPRNLTRHPAVDTSPVWWPR
jgi:Tol biopolymer transport system component